MHFQDAISSLVTQLNEGVDMILGHAWLLRHKPHILTTKETLVF